MIYCCSSNHRAINPSRNRVFTKYSSISNCFFHSPPFLIISNIPQVRMFLSDKIISDNKTLFLFKITFKLFTDYLCKLDKSEFA